MTRPRLAVVCDFAEENWPSMDLVADMLLDKLAADHSQRFDAVRVCPALRQRFGVRNADRIVGRFWDYPREIRRIRDLFDLFHIVDHSYAHLLHELPTGHSIVTCHDLDTFRSIMPDPPEHRSRLFRTMTRRIWTGLARAAWIACDSQATRDELLARGIVPESRTSVVPMGVHPSCSPDPDPPADREVTRLLGDPDGFTEILHVGSVIPRKRIDVLLAVFHSLRSQDKRIRLLRVGGPFTAAQAEQALKLGIADSISVLPFLTRQVLAAVYRRAALVLQTSEAEGFGLPVVEAMASGTPVIASDLRALREVGGEAAIYCQVGDTRGWSAAAFELLNERTKWQDRRAACLAQAAGFSWAAYTDRMTAIYREVLAQQIK